MTRPSLGDHLDGMENRLAALRALTGRALPLRRARKARIAAMQTRTDGLRDRMRARAQAVHGTNRRLSDLARRRRRAARHQLLSARLTLAWLVVIGFFRLYWRVMAMALAMAALVWLAWLIWPHAVATIEALRDWLQSVLSPATLSPAAPSAIPSPNPTPAPPPAAGALP